MVAPRRLIALPTDADQRQRLPEISRSRTEPTNRVERARIILAYLQDPSAYAIARTTGVTQQTVTRCLERAVELGVIAALDEQQHRGTAPRPRNKVGKPSSPFGGCPETRKAENYLDKTASNCRTGVQAPKAHRRRHADRRRSHSASSRYSWVLSFSRIGMCSRRCSGSDVACIPSGGLSCART
jgi:hypothetical protein